MPKWEYLFVTCEYANQDWRPRYVNGQELHEAKPWGEMTIYDFSNLLGQQAWELVDWETTHNQYGGTESFRLVFKRPVV
jgi:hypothetical protein